MRNEREHNEQKMVIVWCELNKKLYPCLDRIYAIANGGDRHLLVAMKLKKEGVKAGMLDLCLPWPLEFDQMDDIPLYFKCGLYVEMKALPKQPSKVSPKQKEWIKYLLAVGYEVHIAWSADEAIRIIKNYVNSEETGWTDFQ